MRILVRRIGAFGDVMCTTPIIRRLVKETPAAQVHVQTAHPYCFRGNDYVQWAGIKPQGEFERFIDLDMAYEKRLRKIHTIDAYMLEAFGDTDGDKAVVLRHADPPRMTLDWTKVIVIHPGRSWPQRTPSAMWWVCVVDRLMRAGRQVVVTGGLHDLEIRIPGIVDVRGQLNCNQQAGLIEAATCFIGNDCGVWGGIVPATTTPAIGLATMTAPEIMKPYRIGGLGWRTKVFAANVPCVGCSAELEEPVTDFACRYGTNACAEAFDPIEVADAAMAMKREGL